jgi:alkylation response protein AidB-like acyl-CoA dehydrogenase
MEFSFTPEQVAFRRQLRAYFDREFTPEVLKRARHGTTGGYQSDELRQKLIDNGWYVVHWPKEEGGLGLSAMELAIFYDELGYSYVGPQGLISIAENIKLYGTEEQKKFFLPRFARGELHFTLGISEPNAGVDAANIAMEARLEGDEFVINGQKMWGGQGWPGYEKNNWHWLIVRTDKDLPRHRGLSILMVPLETPGITIRPVWTLGSDDEPVAAIYYDNVRAPRSALLGELNRGWYQLMTGLDVLRAAIGTGYLGEIRRTLDDLVRYVREQRGSGRWIADSQVVRHRLADLMAETRVAWLLAYHIASLEEKGHGGEEGALVPASSLAAMIKIWCAELLQKVSATGMEILGPFGLLVGEEAERWQFLGDHLQWMARYTRQISVGGGSSEVLRTQLATRTLGMPR